MKSFIKKNWLIVVIAAIAIPALLIRLIMLADIPRGWNIDEAGTAYDAWCIAKYGVDRFRYPYPFLFMNYGGGGQSSMYTYLTALLFKVFDFSRFVVRIPAVVMSMMVMISGILFLKMTVNDKKQIVIWTLLYAILPYFIMSARLGLDCNLMLGASSIFIVCLTYALKKEKLVYYVVAGIACGLVLYTYSLSYIVMILFLLMMFIYLMYMRKLSFKQALCFCIPVALLAAPLIFVQLINILGLETRTIWKFTFIRLTGYRISELSFPKPSNILIMVKNVFLHDDMEISSNAHYMTLYIISIPFFVIGIIKGIIGFVKNIRHRSFSLNDTVLLWFTAEFIMGLMLAYPNVNRLNAIYFAVLFYIVKGIVFVIDSIRQIKLKVCVGSVIFAAYAIFAVFFIRFYFTEEIHNKYLCMEDSYSDVIEFIESQEQLNDIPIYIDEAAYADNVIYIHYIVSCKTPPSPYDIDLRSNTLEIGRYRFGLPDEEYLTYNACYVILKSAGGDNPKLYPLGLKIQELDNGVTVFYPNK